ncbi:oxidoreductase, 2OG-Fe(II) oxygenase family [Reticulomyxa filosa]|uniref:Oxidoreductase, 2OG-Fe(II) oxygenase family n=1 Tax=Reticulomyxa filosa TaxID=46433 RepID=X6NCW4_RETFI|nr:oxidoreductase, 2OG-Fe(II) oxygenase family [Reticulomyxa filosa]|eukprot:ETO24165.1 oxidoreductase, 2OG-Fe(II) oxygenase family [Reticulomyxa filosa]
MLAESVDTSQSKQLSLPIIDISCFVSSPKIETWETLTSSQRQVLEIIHNSFSKYGFLLIRNKDLLDSEFLTSAFKCCKECLEDLQSKSDKATTNSSSPVPRGFAPLHTENFATLIGENKPNDWNMKFRMGPEYHEKTHIQTEMQSSKETPYYHSKGMYPCNLLFEFNGARVLLYPNQWPEDDSKAEVKPYAKFKEHMIEMYGKFYQICRYLLHIFGLIFEIPDNCESLDQLSSLFDKHTSILSTNLYPYQSKLGCDSTAGKAIEQHTDVDVFTIIAQNNCEGGLQIQINNEWHTVKNDDISCQDYLIVNIGDCLEYWTNGYWKSTMHRVIIPQNKTDRQVMAFFVGANHDAVLKPLHINPMLLCSDDVQKKQTVTNHSQKFLTYFEWRKKRIRKVVKISKKFQTKY